MRAGKNLVAVLLASLLLVGQAMASDPNFQTAPQTNQGQRWRVAYYEGGDYSEYLSYLQAVAQGLMTLGWIQETEIPSEFTGDSKTLWRWLSRQAKSDFLHFLEDGFYTANWDQQQRSEQREALIHRLNQPREIDLIIAMGTWAGRDLANNRHQVPTIVMSASDPIRSGIIKAPDDSGYEHVHARIEPGRYARQARVFHNLIGFERLGVPHENTPEGRSYAGMEQIQALAEELGFELVSCYTQSDIADLPLAGKSVVSCFEALSPRVDAIYITAQGGVNKDTIGELVEIANRHRVPTFSQVGGSEVRYGFLMSFSQSEYQPVGQFLAATMARVFNGAKPNQLPQVFEAPAQITVNLKTAEAIGLYLYADLLAAADVLYRQIEVPNP